MNKVILIGRTARDIELRQAGQTSFAKTTIVVNRRNDGADFIPCTAFGKTAEIFAKYVKKGDRVGIVGRIQTGSYEKDGQKHYTTDVVVEELEFLEKKQRDDAQDQFVTINDAVEDDDLPF